MIQTRPASVRARLLLIVLLAVLPALAFIAYDAKEDYRRETTAALDQAVLLARLVSSQHDDLIAAARQLLVALAQLPEVRLGDRAGCDRLFVNLLRQYTQYANLGAARRDGEAFCSAVASQGVVNLADRPWFQEAVRNRDLAIGEYLIGRFTGKPILVFGYPVLGDAGDVVGVVFAGLDLAWFNRIVATAPLPSGTVFTVLDRTGTVLARYPEPARWVGQAMPEMTIRPAILSKGEGTAEGMGPDGIDRLYAFKRLGRERSSGAHVSVAIPKAHVFANVRVVLIRDILGLTLATGAMLILVWFGSSALLLRPVRTLVEATQRLRDGDLTVRTGLRRDAGELGFLGQAFDDMAVALEQRACERERAEAALRESEEQYRSLVESSSDAILLRGPDGKILAANATACQLFGMTEAEICQVGPGGLADSADPRVLAHRDERARTGRVRSELRCRRNDGSTFDAEVSSSIFLDRHGAPCTSLIIRDITERKRMEGDLRDSERRLRETVESLQHRTDQLEALRATAADITRELELTTLLHLVARRACELTGSTAADIDLWDTEQQVLVPEVSYGHAAPRPQITRRPGEGAMGTVAQQRQGVIINDYRASPLAHPETLAHTKITASLIEPLLYHERLLGVIGVDHEIPGHTFSERDQATLRLFAAQAAIAIENARLFSAVDQAARAARSLCEVAHSVTTSLNVAEVLQLIVVKTTALLNTPHAQVVLWDEATRSLRLGAAHGTQVERVKRQEFRRGVGVNGIVADTRVPLIVNDYHAWPHRVPGLTELVAVIGVPLLYRDRLLGVLTTHATAPGSTFTSEHCALLTNFADQAAVALENARLYEEVRRAAADLETRVETRTRELAEANRQLEAASQHKSEFLANMSHELRTPLNSILGFAQLLLEQTADVLSTKQRRFLNHIYTSGQHLLQLINDILDLSKVEAGKLVLHPESVVVSKIVDETLVIVRGLADKKDLGIEVTLPDGLPPLVADPIRLKQILFNLLSNAVKFTPEGGQVTVNVGRVGASRSEGDGSARTGATAIAPSDTLTDWLEVRVTDTGVGIKAEDLPRLFHDFVQLEATATKRHEGTGLGLALTKQLVELHGGHIWAESAGPGQGACFVVQLPFLDVPVPRILVVDDEEPFRRLLVLMLGEAGYRVQPAEDVAGAIQAVDAEPPALAILDVGLPPDGAGGWTILAHLRKTEALRTVPVLVLTGQDQVHAEEALARGANEFLGKPVSPHVLEETVARLLKAKSRRTPPVGA